MRLSGVLINIFASRFGTTSYAIISVCRKGLVTGQTCLQPLLPVWITKWRRKSPEVIEVVKSGKECIMLGTVFYIGVCILSTFLVKGELTSKQIVIPAFVSQATALVAYIGFLLYDAYLTIMEQKSVMSASGNVRLCTTIIICLCSLIPVINYWMILLYSTITDFAVAAYCAYRVKRSSKN